MCVNVCPRRSVLKAVYQKGGVAEWLKGAGLGIEGTRVRIPFQETTFCSLSLMGSVSSPYGETTTRAP